MDSLIVAELPASLASVTDDWLFEQYFVGTAIDLDDDHFYYAGVGSSTDVVAGRALRSNGSAVFSSTYTSGGTVCNSISADSDGNAYIAGSFKDEIIFENGTLTAGSSTYPEMFAVRLDATDGESFKLEGGEDAPSVTQTPNSHGLHAEVHPNPTDGLLHVRLHGLGDGQRAVAELFDMRGAQVAVTTLSGPASFTLGLGHLADGTYILMLSTDEERSFHRVTLAR